MQVAGSQAAHVSVVRLPSELRALCDGARASGHRVGVVPTMGALHEGHLALVREARRRASLVVVSIFVNPTQFGPNEDYERYPRDLVADVANLAAVGPAVVFAPERGHLYPEGDETRVRVGALAEPLCGRSRPGHFEGVATVVAKLFALVGACDAIFGRKDYQQWLVVRRMARDLFYPVEVVGHPIVREADGVAMSSRNAYLSAEERSRARAIVEGLDAAARAFAAGERRARELEAIARSRVEGGALVIEYVEALDPNTLAPFEGPLAGVGAHALLAVACRIGRTRLIDNVLLGDDPPPLGDGPPLE